MNYQGLVNQYFEYLPIKDRAAIVTLHEGATPLIPLNNLQNELDNHYNIFVKFEGLNPTGSFKDRGMTLAVTHANEKGVKAILCASTGNTSASAAAYAARANMQAFVIIPEGKIAMGKLVQALAHGAKIIQIKGNFDDAMSIVKSVTQILPIELVNSVNPYRLEGQKTAAFEIVEALGKSPDYHCLPVGNAGNISAYWMGYEQYYKMNISEKFPQMMGFQASGSDPFVVGEPIKNPETIATAIRIGAPQSWDKAVNAVHQSSGKFSSVTDQEIIDAQRYLAQKEGVFCEPASAASIAGLIKEAKLGYFNKGATIVCTLTGIGLKDPDIVVKQYHHHSVQLPTDKEAIINYLETALR